MEASGPHHDMTEPAEGGEGGVTEPAEGGEGGVMEPTEGGEGGFKCHGCDRLFVTDRQKKHYRLILIDNGATTELQFTSQ